MRFSPYYSYCVTAENVKELMCIQLWSSWIAFQGRAFFFCFQETSIPTFGTFKTICHERKDWLIPSCGFPCVSAIPTNSFRSRKNASMTMQNLRDERMSALWSCRAMTLKSWRHGQWFVAYPRIVGVLAIGFHFISVKLHGCGEMLGSLQTTKSSTIGLISWRKMWVNHSIKSWWYLSSKTWRRKVRSL